MSCTTTDLENTFQKGVKSFNDGLDATIGNLLHSNVSIYSYNKHGNRSGIKEVEKYFLKEFAKGAQFEPTVAPGPKGYQVSGLSGKVTGTATWTTTKPKNTISFGFEIQFICEANKWLFLNLDCFDPKA